MSLVTYIVEMLISTCERNGFQLLLMTKFVYLNIWFVFVCMDKADIAPPQSSQANQTDGDEDAELCHVAQYVRLLSVLKA